MAFAVRLETAGHLPDRRRAPRSRVRLIASVERNDDAVVFIHDLSVTGMLLDSACEFAIGERLQLEIAHGFQARATVEWKSGRFFGCSFDQKLSSAAISAARLKSSAEPSIGEGAGRLSKRSRLTSARLRTALQPKLPRPRRLLVMVTSALLIWAILLVIAQLAT